VVALGRLGWSLGGSSRRREFVARRRRLSSVVRDRGAFAGKLGEKSLAKAATLVTTGSDGAEPGNDTKAAIEVTIGSGGPEAANSSKAATSVITGFLPSGQIWRKTSSARPAAVTLPRADRVGAHAGPQRDGHLPGSGGWPRVHGGYQSVRRFVRGLRGATSPEARVIIETRPVRNAKLITAPGRWCAIPTAESTGARGCS